MYRPFWAIVAMGLLLGCAAVPARGQITILVDEIHGRPLSADLAEALPACTVTALTPAAFPITDLLATGVIFENDLEIFFTVPEAAETLYLRFDFTSGLYQQPFITLYGPDGSQLGSHCEGSLHLEVPHPGEYRVAYSTWYSTITGYEIGTGPSLFSTELLDGYDLLCNLWDDTMLMFRGELPPYSSDDEASFLAFLEAGGGFLYVREPLIEMALKPVINLYSPTDVVCNLDLGFPGRLTFAEPPCLTEQAEAGTWLRWPDISLSARQPVQILYEGKLNRRTNWLMMPEPGDVPTVANGSDQPLAEVNLIRHEGADNWRLVRVGAVAPGRQTAGLHGEVLDGNALKRHIESTVRDGGLQAGLYPEEIEEFLAHYHWADRWLVDARADGQWCGYFRISPAAYDAHIPQTSAPSATERVRTLWVWATGLGAEPAGEAPASPPWQLPAPSIGSDAPLTYHEFGVQYQRGPGSVARESRDFGFLDWTFYDGAAVLDPTDNCGEPECPWFSWTGGHPAAAELMEGVAMVVGSYPGTLTAPWSEQVLIGDDDAFTDDWVYPPGSHPPVAAARNVGSGRAAVIHTLHVLSDYGDNRTFLNNVAVWLANNPSPAQDIPVPGSRITALTPNPFNPRTTVTLTLDREQWARVAVYDLAGKRVAVLAEGNQTGGDQILNWNGRDNQDRALPSGTYFVRLETDSGTDVKKAVLVR